MSLFTFDSSFNVAARAIDFTFNSSFNVLELQSFAFNSSFNVVNNQSFSFDSSFSVKDPTQQSFNFASNFLVGSAFNVEEYQAVSVQIDGYDYDVNDLADTVAISANNSNVAYSLSITGLNVPTVPRDTPITVRVGSEIYNFIVDKVDYDADGTASLLKTLTAVSPVMAAETPRADLRDYNNADPQTAKQIVRSLLPVNVNWCVSDWTIPEFRLAVQGQSPLQIANQVVKATGAVIQSLPNGEVEVVYDYPVSPPDYDLATVDHELNTYDHAFTLRTSLVPKDGYNIYMVTDTNTTSGGLIDALDFEVISPSRVTITAYLSSDRPVTLEATTVETVSITTDGQSSTIEETETLEVVAGKARTTRPIQSIVSTEFVSAPLSGLSYKEGSTELNVGNARDYGVLEITYNTTARKFQVSDIKSPKIQFLLKDA
ncbi:hypothetical protein [Vibrio phage vB_VhaS-a]|nr:hypothetical protein [Vibrio phage vB_VhaS-a]